MVRVGLVDGPEEPVLVGRDEVRGSVAAERFERAVLPGRVIQSRQGRAGALDA
jgi:hypothetical protein